MCITETWLNQCISNTAVSLPNSVHFRNDGMSSVAGSVCAFTNCTMKARRIHDFKNPNIQNIWISIGPKRLPRSISVILSDIIYHGTSCNAAQNVDLYNHIQQNVDLFLCNHPVALVVPQSKKTLTWRFSTIHCPAKWNKGTHDVCSAP